MRRLYLARMRLRRQIVPAVSRSAVLLFAALWLVPIVWMLSTSLKPRSEVFSLPVRWIPETTTLANFVVVLTQSYLLRWFFNSLWTTAATTALVVVVQALAAYAFARLEFPGRSVLFVAVLATLMIPIQVTLIPLYLLFSNVGLVNTYTAVIVPPVGGAFGVFLLKQFFEGIPREIDDAARIDGCTRLGIFLHIILPLSKPALSALGIFTALTSWNDFLWPLVVLQQEKMMTLPVGLSALQATYTPARESVDPVVMAGAVLASVPILVLYAAFQDRIAKGITLTSGLSG